MNHSTLRRPHTFAARLAIGTAAAALTMATVVSADAGAHRRAAVAAPGFHVGVNKIKGGNTVVTPDAAFGASLTGAGITAGVVAPATSNGTAWTFPISDGSVVWLNHGRSDKPKWKLLAGFANHTGGLTLSKAATTTAPAVTVSISDLRANLSAEQHGVITGKVVGLTGQAPLLWMSDTKVDTVTGSLSAKVKLTPFAARQLDKAFATTAFTAGQLVGTVVSTPTF